SKVRNGIPCGFIERSSTLHPVAPYRSSNLTDRRDPHNGSTPVPPPPTALGDRIHWTMSGRRLSPYRSRASPRRKPPAFKTFCMTNRYCAHAPGEPRSTGRYTARLPRTTRSKINDPRCPYPTPRPFHEPAVADKVLRCYGAGGEGVASFGC